MPLLWRQSTLLSLPTPLEGAHWQRSLSIVSTKTLLSLLEPFPVSLSLGVNVCVVGMAADIL